MGTGTPVVYTHAYAQVGKTIKNSKIKISYPFTVCVCVCLSHPIKFSATQPKVNLSLSSLATELRVEPPVQIWDEAKFSDSKYLLENVAPSATGKSVPTG